MELSRRLTKVADECADMHQYAMRKYADAFHIIPTTLAEVSGHNAVNVITSLMADHQNGCVCQWAHEGGHILVETRSIVLAGA